MSSCQLFLMPALDGGVAVGMEPESFISLGEEGALVEMFLVGPCVLDR